MPWLVGLCITSSVIATLVPVRFRDRNEVLSEAMLSIQLLAGLAFALILALPAMRREHFHFLPSRWGVPAISSHRVVAFDALGVIAVLGILLFSIGVLQIVVVSLLGPGTSLSVDITICMIYGYVYCIGIVGWARLIGFHLPGLPGMILLFVVAVLPQFVSGALFGASSASWSSLSTGGHVALALLPVAPPVGEFRQPLALLWLAGAAIAQFAAANLFISWSLEHLQPERSVLDRPRGGS